MKNQLIVRRLLVIAAMILAVWAAGAGRASAQCVECPPPPSCDSESEGPGECLESQTETFAPGSNSHTFTFDDNNSIKITTQVSAGHEFAVTVEQWQISQEDYQTFRRSSHFPASECWETGGPALCIFYRVITSAQNDTENPSDPDYTGLVHYIIGFTTPAVKGNKHDLMLLRSELDGGRFDEEITTKVLRNYQVGDDPGVGGNADSFSDYLVAFEPVRPASK